MERSLNLFANALFFVYLCIKKQEIFRFIIKVSSFFIVIGLYARRDDGLIFFLHCLVNRKIIYTFAALKQT
jgi:hypothetical protein